MIEGIIEILICSYINFNQINLKTIGGCLGAIQSYFSLALVIVIMPATNVFLFITACKDISKLDQQNYKEMFGAFYEVF